MGAWQNNTVWQRSRPSRRPQACAAPLDSDDARDDWPERGAARAAPARIYSKLDMTYALC